MRKCIRILGAVGILSLSVPISNAGLLVGQCVEFTACTTASHPPTPWSDALTLTDLTSLGLGNSVPLVAAQTSEFVIRLGVTTMTLSMSYS